MLTTHLNNGDLASAAIYAQPPVEVVAATKQTGDLKNRPVPVIMKWHEFGGPNKEEELNSFAGKALFTERYVVMLTSTTTHTEFVTDVMETLRVGDLGRSTPGRVCRQFFIIDPTELRKARNGTKLDKITNRFRKPEPFEPVTRIVSNGKNWEASRELLLQHDDYSLYCRAWPLPDDWSWHQYVYNSNCRRRR